MIILIHKHEFQGPFQSLGGSKNEGNNSNRNKHLFILLRSIACRYRRYKWFFFHIHLIPNPAHRFWEGVTWSGLEKKKQSAPCKDVVEKKTALEFEASNPRSSNPLCIWVEYSKDWDRLKFWIKGRTLAIFSGIIW